MVAPMVIGALVGAGLGAARQKEEMRKAEQNRKLQATIASQSPWTSMQADTQNLKDPSLMGNVSQGALSGASFGMQDAFKGGGEAPGGAPATPGGEAPGVSAEGPSAVASSYGSPMMQGQAPLMEYQNPSQPQANLSGMGSSGWLGIDPATGQPYKQQTMVAGN